MKIEQKSLSGSQIELNIEVLSSEYDKYLDRASQRLSQSISPSEIKGFRPGKVPRRIMEQKLGQFKILSEAAEDIVKATYVKAILDKKIDALGMPKIEIKQMAPENNFVYKAIISIMPKVDLVDYGFVNIKSKTVKNPSLEEIDEKVEGLRSMNAIIRSVSRESKKGDRVEVDFESFIDKAPLENGKTENHPIIIGKGMMVKGFEEELIGLKKSDRKEFDIIYPKDFPQKHLASRKVHFKLEMKDVQEFELPRLDDKLAQSLGKFENLEDLRQKTKENLKKEEEFKEEQRAEKELLEEFIEKSKFDEIPDILIEQELDKMVSEYKDGIRQQGVKFGDYLGKIGKTKESLRSSWKDQAEKRAKIGLVLREIARKEKITISRKELDKEISKSKQDIESRIRLVYK